MWKLKDINQYLVESRGFTLKELQKKAQELLKGLGIAVPNKKLLDDTVNHIKNIISSERAGIVFESIDSQSDSQSFDAYIDMIQESTCLEISRDELEYTVILEFFGIGKFFKKLLVNPRVKKQIRKLSDELVKIRVEQARSSLEMPEDDFESHYSSKGSKSTKGTDKKVEALEDQAQAIEAKMDLLASEDEKLQSYLEVQKIDARIRANAEIIKLADDVQKKILSTVNKDLIRQGKTEEKEFNHKLKNRNGKIKNI
jgi:phage terminase small subunit